MTPQQAATKLDQTITILQRLRSCDLGPEQATELVEIHGLALMVDRMGGGPEA
jgi:hypothetical protein